MNGAAVNTQLQDKPLFHLAYDAIEEKNKRIEGVLEELYLAASRLAPIDVEPIPPTGMPVNYSEEHRVLNTLATRTERLIFFQEDVLQKLVRISNHLNRNV